MSDSQKLGRRAPPPGPTHLSGCQGGKGFGIVEDVNKGPRAGEKCKDGWSEGRKDRRWADLAFGSGQALTVIHEKHFYGEDRTPLRFSGRMLRWAVGRKIVVGAGVD